MLPWHQYLMGLLYVIAGMNHFRKPKMYERIMPPYIPAHSSMVMISGIAEMILGFMIMNKSTQATAAWGIIIMLILLGIYAWVVKFLPEPKIEPPLINKVFNFQNPPDDRKPLRRKTPSRSPNRINKFKQEYFSE